MSLHKIALGGGCHWCTEAVFQSLQGVTKVEQGFVASTGNDSNFSEAVIVHFSPNIISLKTLIEVHLHTHKSTSNHSMRSKYRSAIYTFSTEHVVESEAILNELQATFGDTLITKILPFIAFKPSEIQFKNYYYSNPEKPFCTTYISPKLQLLKTQFTSFSKH
ncbi:peptide-methionine (S)-S-oxide reductase [Zobellia alginiliquefaciens]|uniref:peptide-methionine (S)-S-oxide reductase n=1 Tax=Zobellia alginiliquefaciens TaxID=3032586 RepID=UPI0023E1A92B|nr:peptide-methionine (S)-S-oxide reductase [Zobellia alginiliquefaciens]